MSHWVLALILARIAFVGAGPPNGLAWTSPGHADPPAGSPRPEAAGQDRGSTARPQEDALDYGTRLDRFRAAHPEFYGITDAPKKPVRWPAEYEPVDAIYLAWDAGTADDFFFNLARILTTGTTAKVFVLHHGAAERSLIRHYLKGRGTRPDSLTYIDAARLGPYFSHRNHPPYDRALESHWATDWGPVFVFTGSGALSIVDFRYEWWRVNDDALPTKLAAAMGLRAYRPDLELDGGNLLSDGQGTCYTATEPASADPYVLRIVDRMLKAYLGCAKVIRLRPLDGEPTGHVDMFLQVLAPGEVLLGQYAPDSDAENSAVLEDNALRLAKAVDARNRRLVIHRIPMPENGDGIFRTYVNSILVNSLAVVPVYPDFPKYEKLALDTYRRVLPGWTVVTVDAEEIILGGGAVRCATRTRPTSRRKAAHASGAQGPR